MTDDLLKQKREAKFLEFTKKKAALRYRLMGLAMHDKEWYKAVLALDFMLEHHTGFRKDGITPNAMHQVEIASLVMTYLPHLLFPVRTVVAALLHDTPEDTPVSHEEVRDNFGSESADDVELLTKEYRGEKKDVSTYHAACALNPVTSVVKPADRTNNMSTMMGVFNLEKQIIYCDEVRDDYFTMLKTARRLFPQQELVYENLKFILTTQLRTYDAVNEKGIAA